MRAVRLAARSAGVVISAPTLAALDPAAKRERKPAGDRVLRVLGVNLHSAFYLARAAVPAMKERRRGSIIALGGMSSLTGRPNTAVVTVAKTGLLGLVRALAAELGPFGIRVNMVMPGFIDTERRHAEWYPEFRQAPPDSPGELAKIPLRRLGRPEDIADACVFLASDASSYVTGDSIRVMGGRVIG